MAIIGLLLLVAAGAVVIDVAVLNDQSINVDAFGSAFTTEVATVMVAGAVAALVGTVGVLMIVDGMRRRSRLRGERRTAMHEQDRLSESLAEERAAREEAETREAAAVAQARDRERIAAQEAAAAEHHAGAARAASEPAIDVRDAPPPPPPVMPREEHVQR
jgi:ABC-type nickel/cobalt efflux system permease component RcnA